MRFESIISELYDIIVNGPYTARTHPQALHMQQVWVYKIENGYGEGYTKNEYGYGYGFGYKHHPPRTHTHPVLAPTLYLNFSLIAFLFLRQGCGMWTWLEGLISVIPYPL